jgi:hypothetical protein
VALFHSLTSAPVALGSGPVVASSARILGFASEPGRYRAYVCLTALDGVSGAMIFVSDPEDVTFDALDALLAGAVEMVEMQGFDMERLDFPLMAPDRQKEILRQIPFESVRARTPAGQRDGEVPPPPVVDRNQLSSLPVTAAPLGAVEHDARRPVEISREISLHSTEAVEALARVLSLF